MKKNVFLALSVALALIFSACNKNLKPLDSSYFTTNPNPLEAKGGKVEADITGKFPVKYFSKNAVVTVTPVLVANDNPNLKWKSAPQTFQGEKVKGNDQTIQYKAGGTYNMKAAFNYVPEMAQSALYLTFDVVAGKKQYTLPMVKLADGVIGTAETADKNLTGAVIIPDKFQRIIQETQEADIKFLIQQSNLRTSETKSAEIAALTQKIKAVKDIANEEISGFEISGYASPDGAIALNTNLADKRQKVTSDFIKSELKKIKSQVTIDSKFTAEDWDGFQALMEKSNIQDKQVILRVLSMYTDPEQREREIKNLSTAFKQIADEILPQLRRSKLKLTVDVIGKSDDEIASLAKSNPKSLTIEELLYAASIAKTPADKAAIYQKVVELYPNEIRGYNNLGVQQYSQSLIPDALSSFEKALSINPKDADANYNAGLCSLALGNISKAEEYFGKAAGTSGNLGNALGTVYTLKGEYAKAKSSFGANYTNNAALLQILNGDYKAAANTLDNVANPNGYTSYLAAIVGARTNNKDAVLTNAQKAVSLDSSLKAKILKDIEFAKYFTDSSFLSILK
ncbi:MAG: hypothetical protein LBN23_02565 [Paludibacter sp.]|jgi:tetratricopeptide (TPR) repeat protein|nr:hypothetical protein [Paludibacter sp.]